MSNKPLKKRPEVEIWQAVFDAFDTFFKVDRVTCLTDLIIYIGRDDIGILNRAERDLLLHRLHEERTRLKLDPCRPFWPFGDIEPRKEFILTKIKDLTP